MTSLAERTIASLRRLHDDLAALVPSLSAEQLSGPSGASEWSVAQVLSHLGSAAEIAAAPYRAGLDGTEAPGPDFNPGVWDRWNALGPQQQADGFVASDAALLALLESLTPEQRETAEIKLGFLPAPLPLASVAGMRLNEVAQHAWDVHVALDPAATVDEEAAAVVLEHFAGGLGFLLGFTGKADRLTEPAVVRIDGTDLAIAVADSVALVPDAGAATATFTGGPEAVVRLLGGRLGPAYTSEQVAVTGNVTLDDLRRVFPGY